MSTEPQECDRCHRTNIEGKVCIYCKKFFCIDHYYEHMKNEKKHELVRQKRLDKREVIQT